MCINGFDGWEFQNACRCDGTRKNIQFNTKVNNNLLRLNPNNPIVILRFAILTTLNFSHFLWQRRPF
jgi:hypothetical protein